LPLAVRELGGIEEYRLPNGLQVLLLADAAQTTTTVNITYRVGSRYEVAGEYGMAHLLEHLLFKGTERHHDIEGALALRGVGHNATTTADCTNYFASFNANADTLDFLLDLEADRMVNSPVAKDDLDTEMTVVRNEFERGENEPSSVLIQRVNAAAFSWHPYGRATIGARSDIENVPVEKLQTFYKRYYRPDNATLLITGVFDKAATLALIARYFGPIAKPMEPIPQPYTVEPAQDGERSVVVRRVGGQPHLRVAYRVPALTHPDTPALIVYGLLMSLQPDGPLHQHLAGLGGLASVSVAGGVDPGLASIHVVLPPDADVDRVQALLVDLFEGRMGRPFDESDLQRVRDGFANDNRQRMKNSAALIQQISGLIAAGDWRLLFKQMEDLPKVTLADVERVRGTYFKLANRTVGRYLPAAVPQRVEIPSAPALEPSLATLKGPPRVEDGESLEPLPAALEARTVHILLPSGIALHSLQKQTRGNSVVLKMQLRWGERDAAFARNVARLVGPLILDGSAGYTRQQLRDLVVKLGADLELTGDEQGATITVSAERDTLLPALRAAADLLRHPLLPQHAFDRDIQHNIASLEASRQDLGILLEAATRGHFNAARSVSLGDSDYLMSVDEHIAKLKAATLDEVKRFHADYWSANDAQVSVAGSLPDGLAEEVERLFGDWKKPAAPTFVRHVPRYVDVPPARFDALARDKASAIGRMQQMLPLSGEDPDYLALALAVRIFGVGMDSRLSERVRQKEGLTYNIGISLDASAWGNAGSFGIEASYAPENRDRIVAVVRQEVARMSARGVTAAELARNKKSFLEGRKSTRMAPGQLAGYLIALAERGETWDLFQRQDDAIAAVTVEQVNAAWRKYIHAENFIVSTAGDFKP
jgi:zinc protease